MARLKSLLKSALEDRSPRYLLGTIALAVVVALVAGIAIGYKIEQSRRAPVRKVAAKTSKTSKTSKTGRTIKNLHAAPTLVGAVFKAGTKQLIVLDAQRKPTAIALGPRTRVALATPAKSSNITVGSKVVFQAGASGSTTATAVVVLPAKALVGTPVTAVVPGTSMTLKSLQGSGKVIKTTGAAVYTTIPSNAKHIAKPDRVIVQYFIVGKRHPAVEVVVLPSGSPFR